MEELLIWILQHLFVPLFIFLFVSLWCSILGVEALFASGFGVAAGFGYTSIASRRAK